MEKKWCYFVSMQYLFVFFLGVEMNQHSVIFIRSLLNVIYSL